MNTKDVEKLLDVGIALSSVRDLDELLDLILSEAQLMTNADSGSIYLVEGDKLIFKISRSNTYFARWGENKTRQIFKSFEMPITKGSIAGYVALTSKPLNIPDVANLPKGTEYSYNSAFDEKYSYKTVSMLVVPMMNNTNKVIGVLQLINSMSNGNPAPFTPNHRKITMSLSSQAAVAIQNAKLNADLKKAYLDTIFSLSAAAEYKDKETSNHIKRVSHYSRMLSEKMGLPKGKCDLIFWASPMHDIGKLGISDAILNKPGILTDEERKKMQYHTLIGALILKDSKSKAEVLEYSKIIAMTHHEKIDGTGYPQGLKGDSIPLEGRIVALADVYDALSSKRCYKDAFPEEKVVSILKESSGKHFDPGIIKVFFENYDAVKEIKDAYKDTLKDFENITDFEKIDIKELME